ncbi:glutamyl-tRNA reductase [Mariniblastus fucicola]|uniref:Glutamyl-tRNA reductase n=1 Tax=Mariniblastus fucicola TaxID=980251 RepID=A0A5B9PAV2_9BACT|nr:glutamyl-tRNA reductase [Mariniblastus fucicola]QEG20251.1 Glutamyl-tRNA reductase [Mariniblastus fucicola]
MNMMVIGCSHHVADAAFRERVSFAPDQISGFLDSYYSKHPQTEALLLSTCNRTELYVLSEQAGAVPSRSELIELLSSRHGITAEELDLALYTHRDTDAISHLFSVSSSLDSMVVGESQIIAQVKQAYEAAIDARPKAPLIHRTFDAAIRVAKRVSTETKIHENRISVPSVAINVLAKQIFERFDNKKVLVLGAGEMAEETLTYLKAAGASQITIANRTHERALAVAEKFGGQTAPWSDLQQQLAQADLVVSTTGAKQPIVDVDSFKPVMKARNQKMLFVLDLAIPRDFDDRIGQQFDNVYLYSLDDLQRECERNMDSRKTQWPKARKIVQDETESFFRDTRRRASGSTIAQLKKQANSIKDDEFKRLMNRLDSVSDGDRQQIEKAFHRLVNKILHPPLESIQKESNTDEAQPEPVGLVEAMKRLFQLD